jgi:multiple sugar transport system substrate-binding protein
MNTVSNPFTAGKAAITATVRAAVPGIRGAVTDDWDVAHFYKGPTKRVTGMGTLGFALSGTTKHPDDAWSYLSWMYDEAGMKIIASNYGSVPVQKRFFNAPWWKNLPPPPGNNSVFTDAFNYGTLPPRLPFYTTGPFTKALNDGLAAVELGKSKPADVVQSVDAELNKWLAQAQSQKSG